MKNEEQGTSAIASMMQTFADTMKAIVSPLLDRIDRLENGRAIQANKTPDEQFHDTLETIRGSTDDVAKIGLVHVVEGCKSDLGAPDAEGHMHGATFDAEIHYPPVLRGGKLIGKGERGIVKAMLNYTWPEAAYKHTAQGGCVPDGLEIKEDANGRTSYEQWRYETYLQADNRRFVGKALPAHVRPAPIAATGT